MSKHRPGLSALRKVRISPKHNPLESWIEYLTDAEIAAYQLAGYIVSEVG